ncbi:MAG: acyl-CoA thioesterase [Balneolaceae bacterium]|nr:acyl-CoA thioesterase [Balneolaceae bacterium]MCH8547564.1 acyl-CoA thioesterase [Balneolaceae bacterium]
MIKPEYSPERFVNWTEIPVRFRDLDPLNHVNNSVINSYFEEARINFIQHVPEFRKSMDTARSFVLVHLELSYIKPIVYGDSLIVGSSVLEYGNSSIKAIQAIYESSTKELKAVAETTGVWFNLKTNRPDRLPEVVAREKYLFKK